MHFDKPGAASDSREAPTLWSIAGGKGGVGKSVFSSSLAVAIANAGESCAIVDADFGAPNLHTLLGVSRPQRTLSNFVTGETEQLRETLCPTPVRNLSLLCGSRALLEMANLKQPQKQRLLEALRALPVRHVVIDLGAGTGFDVLDFFVAANRTIVVVVPEPTSIENAYHFLRAAFYRTLRSVARRPEARDALRRVLDERGSKPLRSTRDLVTRVREIDAKAGSLLQERAAAFTPKLVVNRAVTPEHRRVGWDISAASREHLGINLGYLGALDLDSQVTEALVRRQSVMHLFPSCRFSRRVDAIAHRLLRDLADPLPSEAVAAARARQQDVEAATWNIGVERETTRHADGPLRKPDTGAATSPSGAGPRRARAVTLPPLDPEHPGAYLRRCRELLGMTLAELTERTRIRGLEHIERERFDELPPPPHLDNFVLQYARALEIPASQETVEAFLKQYYTARGVDHSQDGR